MNIVGHISLPSDPLFWSARPWDCWYEATCNGPPWAEPPWWDSGAGSSGSPAGCWSALWTTGPPGCLKGSWTERQQLPLDPLDLIVAECAVICKLGEFLPCPEQGMVEQMVAGGRFEIIIWFKLICLLLIFPKSFWISHGYQKSFTLCHIA